MRTELFQMHSKNIRKGSNKPLLRCPESIRRWNNKELLQRYWKVVREWNTKTLQMHCKHQINRLSQSKHCFQHDPFFMRQSCHFVSIEIQINDTHYVSKYHTLTPPPPYLAILFQLKYMLLAFMTCQNTIHSTPHPSTHATLTQTHTD